ncbi:MAG TPA: penicillin-binding transpeptidase domain-containing protein, partial [Candidatus Dormibacteraeota bacterium]
MVVFSALFLFAALLGARLYYWQVKQHDWLAAKAQQEHFRDEQIPARRGAVYDVNGSVLATNEAVDSVYGARKQIEDPVKAAHVLSPLINVPEDKILDSISNPDLQFVRLKPWVTADVSQKIKAAQLAGIFLEPTTHRIYPQNSLAAHLLGFTNEDGSGQYGLEEFYNQALSGTPGHLRAEMDTARRPINFITPREASPARDGADLVTSVDSALQYIAERELADAVKLHKASGGSIVVMDPHTGEIMALANQPSFDPNRYG